MRRLPLANAKELSLAAGAAERQHAALHAEVALLQAQLKARPGQAGGKAGDKTTEKAAADADRAVTDAQTALTAAQKAAAEPTENYTRLTPVHPATSTGRRLALARWITSRDNPLAARVAINHIWLRHFGTPLVPTRLRLRPERQAADQSAAARLAGGRADGQRLADEARSTS